MRPGATHVAPGPTFIQPATKGCIMSKHVVVITRDNDEHLPDVQAHLQSKGIDVITIGHQHTIDGPGISFEPGQPGVTWLGDTPLHPIGVWYRKPGTITSNDLPGPETWWHDYSAFAINHYLTLLRTRFSDALWVSDRHAIERAEDKLLQLETATRLGFSIPATLFTSDPHRAQEFVKKQQACVVKPQQVRPLIDANDECRIMMTTRLPDINDVDFSGLRYSPMIFQQYVSGRSLRVTVVGDQVFPAEVIPTDADPAVSYDWRRSANKDIRPYDDFPSKLADLCVTMTRQLGLRFGAFDFIHDVEGGDFWFLEVNPNGQWGFVEDQTKQPIAKAVANLLASKA